MPGLPAVPLAGLTTLRVGGSPRRFVEARTEAELVETVRECDASGEPVLVLGGGSNLLVADAGFPGTVVRVRTRGVDLVADQRSGTTLTVAAGEDWDGVVERSVAEGLAGLECLSGIPGSTGATPIQNVGAYGQDVGHAVISVRTFDRTEGRQRAFTAAECGFGYRHSRFKAEPGRFVVLDVAFQVQAVGRSEPVRYAELARALGVDVGFRAPLAAVREAVLGLRRAKGMVLDAGDHDTWSAGSFFMNPVLEAAEAASLPAGAPRWPLGDGSVKTSAAWLIEQAGYGRGYGTGRARVSGKHALAVTNRGGATAAELVALARELRDGVRARYAVELVPEPVLVGCAL